MPHPTTPHKFSICQNSEFMTDTSHDAEENIKEIMACRKSSRDKPSFVYTATTVVDELKWTKLLATKSFVSENFDRIKGHDLDYQWASSPTGMKSPVVIPEAEGLGIQMPEDLTVNLVAEYCGRDRIIDVIEVSTQTDRQMTLGEWAVYFNLPNKERPRILNVISLECGDSKLGSMIKSPKLVRELDWIDNIWPWEIKVKQYPQVQLYCLMGVQDSYTDFHVDFGGTSVFYHILSGQKTFYFIEPTTLNLQIYSAWSSSPDQSNVFLGDLVPKCIKVSLKKGNTMIIPSGWIHAVFTPVDTIVIGGNFLHGFSIPMQLKISRIESETNVPYRFRFPYFVQMQWYAGKHYLNQFNNHQKFSGKEIDSITCLWIYLTDLARQSSDMTISKSERKTIKSDIPGGLKNVSLMLKNLKRAIDTFKNDGIAINDDGGDGDEWLSDLTEMEFLDSENELESYRPEALVSSGNDSGSESDRNSQKMSTKSRRKKLARNEYESDNSSTDPRSHSHKHKRIKHSRNEYESDGLASDDDNTIPVVSKKKKLTSLSKLILSRHNRADRESMPEMKASSIYGVGSIKKIIVKPFYDKAPKAPLAMNILAVGKSKPKKSVFNRMSKIMGKRK